MPAYLQYLLNNYYFYYLWHYSPYLSFVILCIEVSWSHTIRHKIELIWTSDPPVAEASIYTEQHNI
jgi:hypothetical protein